ncbi:carboxymuconolactone decarboxylase family protein [Rhodoferax ferrireducens]|uniref:(R)-mandelonitrile lyase n=1 Tax=Rhodoferax ferrireducens TaxID=192843 RepID=UPI00298E6590|nr:carboxymuconolactone decarboxylase family protein [Rhodoferax ferrireducens]WPC65328.1 carboxymuconolactone decarboxylase family protein [Rhodoferax ferrireducens]
MKTILATTMLVSLLNPLSAQTVSANSAGSEPALVISRSGTRPPGQGSTENFTGSVKIDYLFRAEEPKRASGAYVTFSPGARTAWHTHPLGQTLIVTAGVGRVQRWGEAIEEIRPGDVVRIPPGVKHWHGAAPNNAMTHLAVQEQKDGKTVAWLEQVSDGQYLPASMGAAKISPPPSRAQQLFGDVAPKLADLTDNVLYGDVWARPGLSPRDRSLVTVSALIAMNRPDQLRSHMTLARQNGLSQDELIETVTHLAFYARWPSAVSAATMAKEVFAKP